MVVGHALHNDFQALKYVHPRSWTRDTTCVPSLLGQPGLPARSRVSLKDLALQLLHKKIQVGPALPFPQGRSLGFLLQLALKLSFLLFPGEWELCPTLPSLNPEGFLDWGGDNSGQCPFCLQVGQHGHSSVEDAATAMELYRLVEARWEEQEGHLQDEREPDSGPDVEQYMEDRYWPQDLAPATSGPSKREEDEGQGPWGASGD